ncbi:hypothetical protein [Fibrella forsythiae]|uniref:Uncharacterized protein n=1 Tax=Fibrella forsythiae TaxID=2817061 RepID=A0ABS3JLC3_9BACT|nr:hypothetical protein [Fibrella forsythiae]MBO0950024.1 hypothetical protein [Fibrella forsythiae]
MSIAILGIDQLLSRLSWIEKAQVAQWIVRDSLEEPPFTYFQACRTYPTPCGIRN